MSFIPARPPGSSSFGSHPPVGSPPSSSFTSKPPPTLNNQPTTLHSDPAKTFTDRQNLRVDSRLNHLAKQEQRLARASAHVDESVRLHYEQKRQMVTTTMNRLQNLQKSEK